MGCPRTESLSSLTSAASISGSETRNFDCPELQNMQQSSMNNCHIIDNNSLNDSTMYNCVNTMQFPVDSFKEYCPTIGSPELSLPTNTQNNDHP